MRDARLSSSRLAFGVAIAVALSFWSAPGAMAREVKILKPARGEVSILPVGRLSIEAVVELPDGVSSVQLLVDGLPVPAKVKLIPGGGYERVRLEGELDGMALRWQGGSVHEVMVKAVDRAGGERVSRRVRVRVSPLPSLVEGRGNRAVSEGRAAGGSISGQVIDQGTGDPLIGIVVQCTSDDQDFWSATITGPKGKYNLNGVAPGMDYRVFALGRGYAVELYDGSRNWETATLVSVAGGAETGGIDFSLEIGGAIVGQVRGLPAGERATVWALSPKNEFGWFAVTELDGTYRLDGLYDFAPESDDYLVMVDQPGMVIQWWDHVTAMRTATPVDVNAGGETGPVDFDLKPGGKIGGVVKDGTGSAIVGASLYAYSVTVDSGRAAKSGIAGAYEIAGLEPAADYRVVATADGAIAQFYNHKGWDDADPVIVADGQTTANIDFDLLPGGTVSGTILDLAGAPIPGATVHAVGIGVSWGGDATSGAAGDYRISGLKSGSYKVLAEADSYPRQFYSSQGSTPYWAAAQNVAVTQGQEIPGINIALQQGTSSFSGTVVDRATGAPLENAFVGAYRIGTEHFQATLAGSDGSYDLGGLLEGRYLIVSAADRYARQFFRDSGSLANATQIYLEDGGNAGHIDFWLDPGGTIAGTVTDLAGNALPSIPITVLTDSGEFVADEARTDKDGRYVVENLPLGKYMVVTQAQDSPSVVNVVDQWFNNRPTPVDADRVELTAETPDRGGIDFALAPGGSISGEVRTLAGQTPLSGVWVGAHYDDPIWQHFPFATLSQDGKYFIRGLPAGRYWLGTHHPQMVTQFWNHTASRSQVTFVDVIPGQGVMGINFDLEPGTSVSGMVLDAQGHPMEGAWVHAWSNVNENGNGARVAVDGSYQIGGLLPAADTFVSVEALGYGPQTYPRILDTTGGPLVGIDFLLQPEAVISGQVMNSQGEPLQDVLVHALSVDDLVSEADLTDSQGRYAIHRLSAGMDYRVSAHHPAWASLWFNGKPNPWEADLVDLTGGSVDGIDFSMMEGRSISGRVTDGAGNPVAEAHLWAWSETLRAGASVNSGPDGDYVLRGLPPSADLQVFCEHPEWVPERYPTLVDVSGGDVQGIDFALEAGQTIDGTVRELDGTPLRGAWVVAWSPSLPDDFHRVGESGSDGSFLVRGLPPVSDYRVFAIARGHTTIFFDGKESMETADPVDLTAGNASAIDFALPKGGCIQGVVTDAAGPVMGATVAISNGLGQHVGVGFTRWDGTYTTTGLAAGTYDARIFHFGHPSPQPEPAASVTVVSEECATWDYELSTGGSISGTIMGPGQQPVTSGEVIVFAFDQSAGTYLSSTTASETDGSYRIAGLPANDDYVIGALVSGGAMTWYVAASDIASATPMALVLGQDLGNVDISLPAVAIPATASVGRAFTGNLLIVSGHSPDAWSSNRTVDVNWSEPAGAQAYAYEWDLSESSTPPAEPMLPRGITSLRSPELQDGVHYFHLRSMDSTGQWGAATDVGPINIDGTSPPPPSGLVAYGGNTRVELGWAVPTSDIGGSGLAGIVVVRNSSSMPASYQDGTMVYIDETTAPGSQASFTDMGVSNDTLYHYAVFSFDHAGNYSSNSAQASVTPSPGVFGGAVPAFHWTGLLLLLTMGALTALYTRRRFRILAAKSIRTPNL